MSNLTVSSVVDAFMQASDQAGMVSALGTIAAGLPINNGDGNPICEEDGSGNAELLGYNGETIGDVIGFSSAGVASVTAASDQTQLPITRTVGSAYGYQDFSLPPGSSSNFAIWVTGAVISDGLLISSDSAFPGWEGQMGTGGFVISDQYVSYGGVYFTIANTDPINTFSWAGNIYVKVIR